MHERAITKWLFLILSVMPLVVFIISAPAESLLGMSSQNKTILLYIYLAMFMVLSNALLQKHRLRIPTYIVVYFILQIYLAFQQTALANVNLLTGVNAFYKDNDFAFLLFMIVVENSYISPKTYNNMQKGIFFILIAAVFVTLIQVTVNRMFFMPSSVEAEVFQSSWMNYRFPSLFYWVGGRTALVLVLPGLLALSFDVEHYRSAFWHYAAILAALVTVLFEKTRLTMVAYMVTLYMYYVKRRGFSIRSMAQYGITIVLLLFIAINAGQMADMDMNSYLENRIKSESATTRLLAFKLFAKYYGDSPVFGIGNWNQISNETRRDFQGRTKRIHVGWLSLFYYWGLVGGVIFITFNVYMFRRFMRIARTTGKLGPLFVWLCLLISNFTHVVLSPYSMATLLALVFARYYELHSEKLQSGELRT